MKTIYALLILTAALRTIDPQVALEVANSIWIEQTLPVLQPFIDVNKAHFDAEVRTEDFADPAT